MLIDSMFVYYVGKLGVRGIKITHHCLCQRCREKKSYKKQSA